MSEPQNRVMNIIWVLIVMLVVIGLIFVFREKAYEVVASLGGAFG